MTDSSSRPAVVFDVGNVLLHWDVALVYPDLSAEELKAFMDEVGFSAWNLEQDRGRSWGEGVEELSNFYPHRRALISRFATDWSKSVPGAIEETVEILDTLHQQGERLFAITNFSSETWQIAVHRFSFLVDRFRDVVVSGDEAVVKPDPRIYRILLERNALSQSECVFIDDSPANVSGARAVGMQALHFTGAAQLRNDLAALGLLDR